MSGPHMVGFALAGLGAVGFCLMIAAFVLIAVQGGWNKSIQQPIAEGRWPLAADPATAPGGGGSRITHAHRRELSPHDHGAVALGALTRITKRCRFSASLCTLIFIGVAVLRLISR